MMFHYIIFVFILINMVCILATKSNEEKHGTTKMVTKSSSQDYVDDIIKIVENSKANYYSVVTIFLNIAKENPAALKAFKKEFGQVQVFLDSLKGTSGKEIVSTSISSKYRMSTYYFHVQSLIFFINYHSTRYWSSSTYYRISNFNAS